MDSIGVDTNHSRCHEAHMMTNTRKQIGTVLDDLRKEKRKALHRVLLTRLNSADGGFRDDVSRDMKDRALKALESSVYEMVSEAVSRVLPVSRTPSAFADIEQAMASGFLDLSQDLEAWYQGKVGLSSARIVENDRANAIRQRLERQLDTYRPEFTNASAGPTTTKSTAGRNPKYDWVAAGNAVWAKLFYAELTPEKDGQAGIEKALLEHFEEIGEEPGVSTVRPYARDIYKGVTRKA